MLKLPRGLRNNNPLNIRISSTPWQGKIDAAHNTDGTFEQFTSMELGIRAALVNIRTYIKRDRLDTVPLIIARWAPTKDGNDVAAYVQTVCKRAQLSSTLRLNYNDKIKLCWLVWAMAFVECGMEISFDRIEKAWTLI